MKCRNCNEENISSAKFCKNCGEKFSKIKDESRPLVLVGNEIHFPGEIKEPKNQDNPQTAQVDSIVFTKTQKMIGAIIVAIVILAVGILVYIVSQNNQKTASISSFNNLASNIKQLQTDIAKKIAEDGTLLSATKKKDVADSNVLDKLQNEIDSAKKVSVDVPQIASDTVAIKQQIQDLTSKKSELQKQSDNLDGAVSAIKSSKQKLTDQIAAEKAAKLIEAITPKDSHSITVTDSNGNKEKITIKIGKWVKGSETDLLEKAWKAAGGTEAMPLTGSYSGDSVSNGGTFQPKYAAYVFGTVSIENMTPDFSAKNFSNGNSWVFLKPGFYNGANVQCRQYSSGSSCDSIGSYNQLVRADMKSNEWGPVSFVIGVETAFSPNFPEGDPKLTDSDFNLSSGSFRDEGDTKFQIGKSW